MELYKFQWRRSVLVVFCTYAILVSAFANGYIPATINQIETKFSLTATQIAGYGRSSCSIETVGVVVIIASVTRRYV